MHSFMKGLKSQNDLRGTIIIVPYAWRLRKKAHYLPLVYVDELSQRLSDLVIVNKTDVEAQVRLIYRPISWGKLRLFIAFSSSLHSMKGLGFTDKAGFFFFCPLFRMKANPKDTWVSRKFTWVF